MLKMFSNLLQKLSEIGKTVKQHSQIKFYKKMGHSNSVNE